jgi:hypothetical protein
VVHAARAGFGGYQDLRLVDIPKPSSSEGLLLMRATAPRVAPLGRQAQYFLDDQPCKGRTGEGARISEVIDLSTERPAKWVDRLADGYVANIIIGVSTAMYRAKRYRSWRNAFRSRPLVMPPAVRPRSI